MSSQKMSFKLSAYVDDKTRVKLNEICDRLGVNKSTAIRFLILTSDLSSMIKKLKRYENHDETGQVSQET